VSALHNQVSPPVMSVRGLSKTYLSRVGFRTQKIRAVHDLSLDLRGGEVLALVGESGSGKSSTARLIMGLEAPTEGEIQLAELGIYSGRKRDAAFRARVQMIFQDPFGSFNPVHTLGYPIERALLRHKLVNSRVESRARGIALLESVGLIPGLEFFAKYPHQASGGQRQRAAIARALAVSPKIILADEPTSMLDVSVRMDILELLQTLKQRQGISYLYITHDLASARVFADRVMVMIGGMVVEAGPTSELMERPAHPYTRALLAAMPGASKQRRSGVETGQRRRHASAPGSGCPFAAGCDDAISRCQSKIPGLYQIDAFHTVRCYFGGRIRN